MTDQRGFRIAHMRYRDEIIKETINYGEYAQRIRTQQAILEALLDVRDLLLTSKEYDFLMNRYKEEEMKRVLEMKV